MIILKTPSQVEKIRHSCGIVKTFLNSLEGAISPGQTTTAELDALAMKIAADNKAVAGFKNYRGFPYAICASINEEVIHGFPSERILEEGDILSVDFGILKDEYYGDAAITLPIGRVSKDKLRLIKTTRDALYKGIQAARDGNRVSDISNAVQKHAETNGYSIVREFVGHAIGMDLHESPQVPNYGKKHKGPILKAGMVIAIEPMLIDGPDARVKRLRDGWTVVSINNYMSAHYEHTILITDSEPEILTIGGTI